MISIIIPVYKAEKTLSKCLNSVVEQTYTNFELILVDDGSPDTSGAICDQWAMQDERIYVIHQENKGVSAARNQGIKIAKGDYVCFIDPDDWVKLDYIKTLYESLLDDEKAGLIIHGFECFSEDGKELIGMKLRNSILFSDDFGKAFTENNICKIGYSWAKLFQRDLICRYDIYFDERIHCYEDLLFVYKYMLYCDYISFCDFQEYVYIKYPVSLSISVNSFNSEYTCFMQYKGYLEYFAEKYSLSIHSMNEGYNSLMILFRRTLKTNYLHLASISKADRLVDLYTLISSNYKLVKQFYNPVYKLDQLGRWLLIHYWLQIFDFYTVFLYKMNIKRMFLNSNNLNRK